MSRIAVIGVPLHGHVRPIVPLLHELTGSGFDVHYYNTERFASIAAEAHALFIPYHSFLETDPDPHPCLIFLNREIPHAISQLEGKLLWEKYDLVMYDSFCLWVKYLALLHKLPTVELFSTYPNALIRDSDPSRLVHLEYADVNLEYIDRYNLSAYTVDCPAMKPVPRATGLHDLQLLDATLKSQSGCPSWITAAKVIEEPAPMNLAFVPEEFMNGPPEKAARYHFLPSLYRLWPAKSKGVEKLIYASFGTRSHIIERLITAWLQRSADGGLKLLVSAGRQAERLQHYADANLSIESFVDQHAVLARASVFITHGGMNGVMEAILTETPMLIVPLSFEQELTARNVHKFQLGIHCPLERLGTVDLQQLIMRLMEDAAIRKNLQTWRARILAAGGAHRAVELIEQHIKGEY